MATFPLTVIEPRPCLPEGRIPVVTDLAADAARRWAASPRARRLLVAGILASAAYGVWRPLSLLVTMLLGALLVRAVFREEVVARVLGPYFAAAVGTFGTQALDVLSADFRTPRRGDRPIGWLLDSWERQLRAATGPVDCHFGAHRIGCEHCPFQAGDTDTRCWPAPFNAWLRRLCAEGLVR